MEVEKRIRWHLRHRLPHRVLGRCTFHRRPAPRLWIAALTPFGHSVQLKNHQRLPRIGKKENLHFHRVALAAISHPHPFSQPTIMVTLERQRVQPYQRIPGFNRARHLCPSLILMLPVHLSSRKRRQRNWRIHGDPPQN